MSSQNVATPASRTPSVMRGATRLFNPLAMLFAGTRVFPLYGVIKHRGRKSGKEFRTPVVIRPVDGGFIVPMPWGPTTDWFRNIRAAGGCTIRWKGRDYQMVEPEVLDAQTAMAAFGSAQRAAMGRFGIRQVARLRFAPR
jgi:deazaflavin-dependent oxidoreductase (nitroreductase family)